MDADKVGEGRVEHTVPMLLSDDHGTDDAFTGRVRWVQIDIDEAAEDVDQLISPDELLRWRGSEWRP